MEGKDVTSVNVKVTLKGFKAIEDLLEEERVSMLLMHVAIMPQCATAELLAAYSCFVSFRLQYLGKLMRLLPAVTVHTSHLHKRQQGSKVHD